MLFSRRRFGCHISNWLAGMADVLSSSYHWSRNGATTTTNVKRQHRSRNSTRRHVPVFDTERSSRTRSRRITLYRNGDRYFPGKQISIVPENYDNLQLFLQQLSTIVDLPYGVRHLFTSKSGTEITSVAFLKDGASYVCASFEPFQKLEYTAISTARAPVKNERCK